MFQSSQLAQFIAFAERPLFASVHTALSLWYNFGPARGEFRQLAHCPAALIPVCHNR